MRQAWSTRVGTRWGARGSTVAPWAKSSIVRSGCSPRMPRAGAMHWSLNGSCCRRCGSPTPTNLWLVSIGGAVDATVSERTLPDVTALCPGYRRPRRATRWRLVSVFRRGRFTLLGALLRHEPLPEGHLLPEPWPAIQYWSEDGCPAAAPALPEAA